MSVVSLTGKDTIIINGRVFNDFADGDTCKLDYPEDETVLKVGKNGNAIYAFKYSGLQVTMDLRLLLGGSDDAFLNNLKNIYENNPPGFILLTGEFIKNVGDGQGNIKTVSYILNGGVFKKGVGALENADGNTDQAMCMYPLIFSNAGRAVGQ